MGKRASGAGQEQQQAKRARLGQAIMTDAELSIMDKILGHLEAIEHLQAIVSEMLDNGTLQAEQPAVAEDEVPPSTNKYRSVDWPVLRDALCQTLPHLAEWLQSLKAKRQGFNTLFAVLTGISKDSASTYDCHVLG